MRLDLFGVGYKAHSWAVTAQSRVNCYIERRAESDRTQFVLTQRPGLTLFAAPSARPTRGIWSVNTLAAPTMFVVQGANLYAISNSGLVTIIGMLNTAFGDVSMVDDGTYLVIVDGQFGYYYNMLTATGPTQITDGNFTTSPKTVTWMDTYFIVTSSATNQFQLSSNANPAVWPAVNINFTGSQPGALKAGIADHAILQLFGDVYTEFWQDAGTPDFPFALIPGAAQEFGLAAPFSLAKFDNSVVGLFKNKMGGLNVSRMSGFNLKRISDLDVEQAIELYPNVDNAQGYAVMASGHPFYIIYFPTVDVSWMFDEQSNTWSTLQSYDGAGHYSGFLGNKFANFVQRLCVCSKTDGNIYEMKEDALNDNGALFPMEVTSKHIWNDDKYVGIQRLQIDMESGPGNAVSPGENPQMDLQVSKDGGNSFYSVGYSSVGKIGAYTQRVIWGRLGAARDWVLRLRISDPVRRIITGASAMVTLGGH